MLFVCPFPPPALGIAGGSVRAVLSSTGVAASICKTVELSHFRLDVCEIHEWGRLALLGVAGVTGALAGLRVGGPSPSLVLFLDVDGEVRSCFRRWEARARSCEDIVLLGKPNSVLLRGLWGLH